MKVTVLGQEYEIIESTSNDDPRLENADGWCGTYEKEIIIESVIFKHEQGVNIDLSREQRKKLIKRHELTHAFFNESGLHDYTHNEQIVNWIAIQFPKMLEAFTQAEAL